jgi:hypothetical protein
MVPMGDWIFEDSPRDHDVDATVADRLHWWGTPRYRDQIAVGDRVSFRPFHGFQGSNVPVPPDVAAALMARAAPRFEALGGKKEAALRHVNEANGLLVGVRHGLGTAPRAQPRLGTTTSLKRGVSERCLPSRTRRHQHRVATHASHCPRQLKLRTSATDHRGHLPHHR